MDGGTKQFPQDGERTVSYWGGTYHLVGSMPHPGHKAPDFIAVDPHYQSTVFSCLQSTPCILSSVLSLSEPSCAEQTRRLSREADRLAPDRRVISISMDLPFVLQEWQAAHGKNELLLLSDHREASFAAAYGVLIKELRLLARAIFVVDGNGLLRHREIIRNLEGEPDYTTAVEQACQGAKKER